MTEHTDTNEPPRRMPSCISAGREHAAYELGIREGKRIARDKAEADTVERIAAWLERRYAEQKANEYPRGNVVLLDDWEDAADAIRRGDWKDKT